MNKEKLFRDYVIHADVEVSRETVANELQYLILETKQRFQYDTLTGAMAHPDPQGELEELLPELQKEALFAAKADLVIKKVIAENHLTATPQELEAEAEAMAKRQNTTVEMIRRFFGSDLALLEKDVLEKKAMELSYNTAQH